MNNHQENRLINHSTWKRHEDKLFESALTAVPEDAADRWEQIAFCVPGKTAEESRVHYEALVHDLFGIESGRVDHQIPSYADDCDDDEDTELTRNRKTEFRTRKVSVGGREVREKPRKKGTPWTEDEHRRFLEGLAKFGKGDWRSISRSAVLTRTSTQVASHAQKYFNRMSASPKERKRSSIHDITISTPDTTKVVQPPPTPPANHYAQGAQLLASPPTPPSNFYVGRGNGVPPVLPHDPISRVYSDQGVGNGTPPPLPPATASVFYGSQGVGMVAPPQQQQQQQQQQQTGYGHPQNFSYPYKD